MQCFWDEGLSTKARVHTHYEHEIHVRQSFIQSAHRSGGVQGHTRMRAAFPDLRIVRVSVLDDASLDELRAAIWSLTGLIRVFLRLDDEVAAEPVALVPPATIFDVADAIHHDLAERCTGARVWGPSARFAGQRVGREHVVLEGDTVEVLSTG